MCDNWLGVFGTEQENLASLLDSISYTNRWHPSDRTVFEVPWEFYEEVKSQTSSGQHILPSFSEYGSGITAMLFAKYIAAHDSDGIVVSMPTHLRLAPKSLLPTLASAQSWVRQHPNYFVTLVTESSAMTHEQKQPQRWFQVSDESEQNVRLAVPLLGLDSLYWKEQETLVTLAWSTDIWVYRADKMVQLLSMMAPMWDGYLTALLEQKFEYCKPSQPYPHCDFWRDMLPTLADHVYSITLTEPSTGQQEQSIPRRKAVTPELPFQFSPKGKSLQN